MKTRLVYLQTCLVYVKKHVNQKKTAKNGLLVSIKSLKMQIRPRPDDMETIECLQYQ